MKVLILEKEKTLLQSLFNLMERYKGYEVHTAHTRREGLSLFERIPFDMVICGDNLPDGEGLEFLKECKKKNPALISILLTVCGDESLIRQAEHSGIEGLLVKPFDLKQLEEAICIPDCRLRNSE